jgi:hypothetical protein
MPWKRRSHSLPDPCFQSGCRREVLHKCHVFHFFSGDGVNDGVCLVLLGPMVIPEGDGHVGSVHAAEVVLGQVAGRETL